VTAMPSQFLDNQIGEFFIHLDKASEALGWRYYRVSGELFPVNYPTGGNDQLSEHKALPHREFDRLLIASWLGPLFGI